MLKVFIAGQKSFGAAVYKAVKDAGYTITGVACSITTGSKKPHFATRQSLSLSILTSCVHLIFLMERML